jgi:LCP family protein required for cell wall assembly
MGDGDNATPGHGAPDSAGDADNKWLTRSSRVMPGAAPWERAAVLPPDSTGNTNYTAASNNGTPTAEDADRDTDDAGGNHTAGVSVAELFARVTGDVPAALQTSTTPNDAPPQPWPDDADPASDSAHAEEIPNLDAPQRTAGALVAISQAIEAPPRRRRSVIYAGRAVAAIMAVLALVLTGSAWQWTTTKNSRLNTVAALDPNSRDIVDPNGQFGDENFLIVGVDSRIGENSQMGAGDTSDAEGARSDTIMLVNIPASRKRVVAVSFPRDTAITPIKCDTWNAQTGQYGPIWDEQSQSYGPSQRYTETKLNSAYSFGGPKCLVKVIQKLSGLSINRFMAIDFAGFAKMVDALGGVEVCSTTPLEDYELGTVLSNAGRQVIDGHTALNYVRARQVTTEYNGDYGRIKRQQMFLSSLLRSLISKDTFFSLSKLNNVVNMFIADSYVDNIRTKDLVDLGQSIQGVSAGRVSFVTLPTSGITDEDGNEVRNPDADRALFDAIINDDSLPGENDLNETAAPVTSASKHAGALGASQTPTASSTKSAAGPTATTSAPAPHTEAVKAVTTAPADVNVHVSNSTAQAGLGSTASTEFEMHGFVVDNADDYSSTLEETTVMFSPGNEEAAATVAAALGNPRIERVTGMGQTVHVVLGPDFHGVGSPLPSGSQTSLQVVRGAETTPTKLPEDLTVTNAADTTCE